jgi:NAD(P)-dependent dehydrogenase (short-subunit alcohol dehydrogenase family)
MELRGASALVTGAPKRVGREIGLELARAGVNVAITYRSSQADADRTVAELRSMGPGAVAVQLDLRDRESVPEVIREAEAGVGPIDILVNNASYFEPTPFPTEDHRGWYATFDVVLHGPYHLANLLAPGMLNRRRGSIINMVDLSAWHPWPDRGAHSVAKAALLALTRQLAVELAPSVSVNAVAAGPTVPAESFDDEQIERLARRTLAGRWGEVSDVAAAVRFLAGSTSITGDCITVDGGERWGHVRQRFAD